MKASNVHSRLRRILKRIASSERLPTDEQEMILNAALRDLRDLPDQQVLATIESAAGVSKALDRAALVVLTELAHLPAVAERLKAMYWERTPHERSWILQTVQLRRLMNFVPQLNRIILEDPDEMCRGFAIGVAGCFRLDVNLPAVLEQARRGHPGVAMTLTHYAREECRPYLREIFETTRAHLAALVPLPIERDVNDPVVLRRMHRDANLKAESVIAAWGLARLGDHEALAYLGEMLYDPVVVARNYTEVGESLRAAQAIADLYQLPFEHTTRSLPPVRTWWEANRERLLTGGSASAG